MSTLLRTIEFLGLSLWLGSDVFLSFVVPLGRAEGTGVVRPLSVLENARNISRRQQYGYNLN